MNQDEDLDEAQAHEREINDGQGGEEHTEEFLKNVKPFQEAKRRSRRRKIAFSIVLATGLIAASGYAGYRYLTREVDVSKTASQDRAAEAAPAETKPGGTYESSILKLEFEYPDGFRVDDDQVGSLSIVSEPITVKDEFSEPAKVVAVLYITEDKSFIQEYEEESLSAALNSSKLVYSSPTPAQRPETRLSFLSVGTSASLDSVIVSGGLEYQAGVPVPYADIEAVTPTIETRFYACDTSECDYKKSARVGIDATEWQSSPKLQQIESIISSLKIN